MTPLDVTVEVEGERYTLALPIGALKEIAEVNPYPFELWQAFGLQRYTTAELEATFTAALKWGGNEGADAEAIINTAKAKVICKACEQALRAFLDEDEPPKKDDAPSLESLIPELDSLIGRTS